jgi:hypothetical protein
MKIDYINLTLNFFDRRGIMRFFTRQSRALLLAAALAVGAVCIWGCGGDDDNNNPGGNVGGVDSRLLGDWLFVENHQHDGGVYIPSEGAKTFITFTQSGKSIMTAMRIYGTLGIESYESGDWRTSGDSLYFRVEGLGDGATYNIFGNTLTLVIRQEGYEPDRIKFKKDNLAEFRRSVGKVYSTNPALINTDWILSEDRLVLGKYGIYNKNRYIDGDSHDNEDWYTDWYTDGSSLFLLGLGCSEYELIDEGDYHYDWCVSYVVAKTVELKYSLLSNGNLRLRPVNSDVWDEWTPYVYDYDGMNKRQSKISERSGHHQSALFGLVR